MSDVSDLRQAKVAAELLAADNRFNSWELSNKARVAEHQARRVAADRTRGVHRASAPEYEALLRNRAADGIRVAVAHALQLRLEPDEIVEIARQAVAKNAP
jgi:hypothetical protein